MADRDASLQILLELIDKASPELEKFRKQFDKTASSVDKSANSMAKSTEGATSAMGAAFSKLAGPIAAVVTVLGSLGAAFKAAIDYAGVVDDLNDMGQKYGYTADQIYFLKSAAEDAGSSLEAIAGVQARVAASMSKTGDDSSKAAEAYKRLGIATEDANGNLRDFQQVTLEVAELVAKGGLNAQQFADAQLVAGKSIKEVANAAIEAAAALKTQQEFYEKGIGITIEAGKVASEYETQNRSLSYIFTVMGSQLMQIVVPMLTEMSKAMQSSYENGGLLAQAFDVLKIAMIAVSAVVQAIAIVFVGLDTGVALVIQTIRTLGNNLEILFTTPLAQKGAAFSKEWDRYWAGIVKTTEESNARITGLMKLGTGDGTLKKPETTLVPPSAAVPKTPKTQTVEEWERYLKQLKDEHAQLGMNKLEKQLYTIEHMKGTDAFKASASALAREIAAYEEAAKSREKDKTLMEAQAKAIESAMTSLTGEIEKLEFENTLIGMNNEQRTIAIKTRELEKLGIDATSEGMTELLAKYEEELRIKKEKTEVESIASQTESAKLDKQREKMVLWTKQLETGKISEAKYLEGVEVILNRTQTATDEVSEFWMEAAKNMQNSMSSFFFDAMQGKITNLGDSFKKMIDKMVADYLASQLSSMLFGDVTRGGSKSAGGGLIGSLFSGLGGLFKADGGPVSGGSPYVVGEVGPELFIPRSNGTIIPADATAAMSGAGGSSVSFNITAMDSQDVIRAMDKIKRPLAELLNGTNRTYNLGVR